MKITLDEPYRQNTDILIARLLPTELDSIGDGTVLFRVLLSTSAKPQEQRAVLNAGYVMAVHRKEPSGETVFLALTPTGRPKLETFMPGDLSLDSNRVLYRTVPMAPGKIRRATRWHRW